jgi:hypothetical protein
MLSQKRQIVFLKLEEDPNLFSYRERGLRAMPCSFAVNAGGWDGGGDLRLHR